MLNLKHLHTAALFAPLGVLRRLHSWDMAAGSLPNLQPESELDDDRDAAEFMQTCRQYHDREKDRLFPLAGLELLMDRPSSAVAHNIVKAALECVRGHRNSERGYDIRRRSPIVMLGKNGARRSQKAFKQNVKLSIEREAGFPLESDEQADFRELCEHNKMLDTFLAELNETRNERSLLAMMRKYLHVFAAGNSPTNSLDQEARLTAAVAWCLAHEYNCGELGENVGTYLENPFASTAAPILVVRGDISGIQDFIFNIVSSRAARQLKSRSFLVQLIGQTAIELIVKQLGIPRTCILLDGGGNFTLFVPGSKERELFDCRKRLERAIHDTGLYVALGWTKATLQELRDELPSVMTSVAKECQVVKTRKFKSLEWAAVFEPLAQDDRRGAFTKLAKILPTWDRYALTDILSNKATKRETQDWQRHVNRLEHHVEYEKPVVEESILFNNTEYANTASDFRFMVKDVPVWRKEPLEHYKERWSAEIKSKRMEKHDLQDGHPIEFTHLGNFALEDSGRDEIAVLKLDVDNLGVLFRDGLGEKPGLADYIGLSEQLQWFFEGYLNRLMQRPEFDNRIYTVFSGGDDVFLLGPWNTVFEFARRLHSEFKLFAGENRDVTLSAGIIMIPAKFSVSRFSPLAEEALEHAKSRKNAEGKLIKDAVHVLGETLSWDCYNYAAEIRDVLVELIREHGAGRDILFKVRRLCHDLKMYLDKSEHTEIPPVYRLAWFLSDLIDRDPQTDKAVSRNAIVNYLVEKFETIFLRAVSGKPDVNPMLFAVAARWAEFSLKKDVKTVDLAT